MMQAIFSHTLARARRFASIGLHAAILIPALLFASYAAAQVLTIDTSGKGPVAATGPVDRQYQQIQPTHVDLPTAPLNTRDKLGLVRIMQAEQGFAMRPLPHGHKGLTLAANGNLNPAGEAYLNMVTSNGMAAKPGDRVVVTNVAVDKDKIVLDFNGGPDAKHRFLRHVSLGTGDPTYGPDTPVVNGPDADPTGARLTITFKNHVPDLTGEQFKALLAPLISFDVKTPIQAYTDTLPKPLKQAILDHEVLVGMNLDMVHFAKGEPENRYHEMDGQMPVDIWLYGKPPEDVTFVSINGNRVIRVEISRVGKPTEVYTKDVVAEMMTAAGQPTIAQDNVRVIREGDAQRDPDRQSPAAPPSLKNPGETLPNDSDKNAGEMKPVHFPNKQPDSQPNSNPNGQQGSAQPSQPSSTNGQSGQSGQGSSTPASGTQPAAGAQNPQQPPPAQPTTVGKNPDDQ
jgi:hypothetical protein